MGSINFHGDDHFAWAIKQDEESYSSLSSLARPSGQQGPYCSYEPSSPNADLSVLMLPSVSMSLTVYAQRFGRDKRLEHRVPLAPEYPHRPDPSPDEI